MDAIKFYSRGKRGEIWLYGVVGDAWGDGISAKQFATELAGLGSVESIDLRINSEGGNVFDGVAIHAQLARHPAHVDVHIDGLAASIASVIAMAGNTISMSANSMMMIHDPWTFAGGSSTDLRKTADLLDTIRDQIADTYSKRTGLNASDIKLLMADETWMDAKAAHKAGFADRVTDDLTVTACADLSRFRNVPKKLLTQQVVSAGHAIAMQKAAAIEQRTRLWRTTAA